MLDSGLEQGNGSSCISDLSEKDYVSQAKKIQRRLEGYLKGIEELCNHFSQIRLDHESLPTPCCETLRNAQKTNGNTEYSFARPNTFAPSGVAAVGEEGWGQHLSTGVSFEAEERCFIRHTSCKCNCLP